MVRETDQSEDEISIATPNQMTNDPVSTQLVVPQPLTVKTIAEQMDYLEASTDTISPLLFPSGEHDIADCLRHE